MALPDTLCARLIETVKTHRLSGNFVMLGRQRWIGSRKGASAQLLTDTIARYLPGLSEADLKDPQSIYSEHFIRKLGFDTVDSMDMSDFEGASLVQDLSKPLPEALHHHFDVVYDGGTCEHIFDLPTAFRNLNTMLRPGGTLIGHSPCNGWINHGFYQITPEMVFGFWQRTLGYEVLDLKLQPMLPNFANAFATTTNPNDTGKRPRLSRQLPLNSPVMLLYVVRKPLEGSLGDGSVYQTDYMRKWDDAQPAPDADTGTGAGMGTE
ncbi:methyltransferase domain-containing protein [Thioclava sp. GXIMD4216]|uniref:methyltransferase domain-containing protein n=1 Tax=Thioclava sp. GXIMD4216 TaxID=3131929 RepID=UPI0030CF0FF8